MVGPLAKTLLFLTKKTYPTKWAPSPVINGVVIPYKWVTGVVTPYKWSYISGVISLLITGSGAHLSPPPKATNHCNQATLHTRFFVPPGAAGATKGPAVVFMCVVTVVS